MIISFRCELSSYENVIAKLNSVRNVSSNVGVVRVGRGVGLVAVDGGAAAGGAAAAVLRGHAGLRLPRPHRRPLLRRQGQAGHRGQARGHGLEVRYKMRVTSVSTYHQNYRIITQILTSEFVKHLLCKINAST